MQVPSHRRIEKLAETTPKSIVQPSKKPNQKEMRTPINSSSLIAFLLCHLLSACLAIGPNGGNGGGPENPVPGARGDAEDEQGTSAAVDIAFEELRIKIPDLLQRNFCFLCILACSSPEVLQSESVQSLPQSLRAYVLEMRSKLVSYLSCRAFGSYRPFSEISREYKVE